MRVGFFTVFRTMPQHLLQAAGLVQEVRRLMPGVEVVQLTDETTPRIPGVAHIQRLPHGPMLQRRLEHYASLTGEWLLLDTDVGVLADVRGVFEADPGFDVALTDRYWSHLGDDPDAGAAGSLVAEAMPFNTGVVFSRSQAFWQAVLTTWHSFADADRQSWFSEQRAVAAVVDSRAFRVTVLPGMVYNYPPSSQADPCDGAALVHYKGARKHWRTAQLYADWRAA